MARKDGASTMLHQPIVLSDGRAVRARGLRLRAIAEMAEDGGHEEVAYLYAAVFAPRSGRGPRLLKVGVRKNRIASRFASGQYGEWRIHEVGSSRGRRIDILKGEDALLSALRPYACDVGRDISGGSEFAVLCPETIAIARPFFGSHWRVLP